MFKVFCSGDGGRQDGVGSFAFVDSSDCYVIVLEVVGVGDDHGQAGVWADASFVNCYPAFYCFLDFLYDLVEGPVHRLALLGGIGQMKGR